MKNRNLFSQLNTPKGKKRIFRTAVILLWVAAVAVIFLKRETLFDGGIQQMNGRDILSAALILMGLFCLKSLTVFFYSGILYAASGAFFPLPVALAVSLAGSALMALLPYTVTRLCGREVGAELTEKHPFLARIGQKGREKPFLTATVARLIALLPTDAVSGYCGAIGMPALPYLAGSLTGLLPDAVCTTVLGSEIEDMTSPGFWIAVGLKAVILLASVPFIIRRKKHKKI